MCIRDRFYVHDYALTPGSTLSQLVEPVCRITDLTDCIICCSALIRGLVFYHFIVVDHRIVTAVRRFICVG